MVRIANDSDCSEIKKLWQSCFDDTDEFVEWHFNKNYSSANTFVTEVENKIVSAMQTEDFKVFINGQDFSAKGLWGVATYPQHRNKGYVRKMFGYALPKMFCDGCDISFLVAAVDGMYEKFGYSKIGDITICKLTDEEAEPAEKPDEAMIPKLDTIYKAAMSNKVMYAERTYEYWRKILYDLKNISNGRILLKEDAYALLYPSDEGWLAKEAFGVDMGKEAYRFPVMARVINAGNFVEKLGIDIKSIRDKIIKDNNISFNKEDVQDSDLSDISLLLNMMVDLFGMKDKIYFNFPSDI